MPNIIVSKVDGVYQVRGLPRDCKLEVRDYGLGDEVDADDNLFETMLQADGRIQTDDSFA